MKYRLVEGVNGLLDAHEFEASSVIAAMGARGYAMSGLNEAPHHRVELQGEPVFAGLIGPMYDGPGWVRYENPEAYEILSR